MSSKWNVIQTIRENYKLKLKLENYKLYSSRISTNFGLQTAKNRTTVFTVTLHKFCILYHCQASHTKVANWTQPDCQTVRSKSRILESSIPKNGHKDFHSVLTTLKLNGKYLRNETRYRQPGTGVENYKGFSSFPKVHELWSTNAEKIGPAYYPLSVNSALCFIARLRTDTDLAHPISH